MLHLVDVVGCDLPLCSYHGDPGLCRFFARLVFFVLFGPAMGVIFTDSLN